jgi:hypothetical protein
VALYFLYSYIGIDVHKHQSQRVGILHLLGSASSGATTPPSAGAHWSKDWSGAALLRLGLDTHLRTGCGKGDCGNDSFFLTDMIDGLLTEEDQLGEPIWV